MHRGQCPIYNGTVETFLCWSSAEKCVCKLIETRLYLESERNTAHTGISGELRLQAL